LSTLINVGSEYITAIDTALGSSLQYLVVDNESTAKAAIAALKRANAGRATFYPITAIKSPKESEEIRIAKEELAKMQAEFNTVKAEFEQQQMLSQVQKELSEKNLPINLAKSLIGKDAETTKANIEKFEVDWKASLQDAIQREIKTNSSSPRTELKGDEGKTKDPKDMSLSEFIEYQKKQQQ
jgi:hypothetical protein